MEFITIAETDLSSINTLLQRLCQRYGSIDDPDFMRESPVYAHELPRPLRAGLNSFRLKESHGALAIRGYQVNDELIGPTPGHWKSHPVPSPAVAEEIFFFLCSSLLGDPIGWATQQDGRVMHDVLPIEEHKNEQLGSGSEQLLTWHTEDAFHPLRTDYVGLMCLRNPDGVATTYASVQDLRLPGHVVRELRKPQFPIRPDRSHLPQTAAGSRQLTAGEQNLLKRSYAWMMEIDAKPPREAVLFGDEQAPFLRIDPYFMGGVYADSRAGPALDAIIAEIDRVITEYVLSPGEILFLDNYQAVHGRVPFKARFDGTDRWLKRLNIVRDLRKSRASRISAEHRLIY